MRTASLRWDRRYWDDVFGEYGDMIVLVNQKSIGKNKRIKTVPLEYKDVPATGK